MIIVLYLRRLTIYITQLLLALGLNSAQADTVSIAVAANFTEVAKELAVAFRNKTGHEATLSFGSSGQLYTQIRQNAPFQIFLSADDARTKLLVREGLGVSGEEFTYAIGKLVLWSKKPELSANEETLKHGAFSKIAIANPVTAPYGAAAIEVMRAINVYDALTPKIVQGNNIAQTFQFVDTENAELGFVALSQLYGHSEGSRWIIPATYYPAIRQNALLLKTGENNHAAITFMTFLKSMNARAIIQKYGYETDLIAGEIK